MRKRRLGIALAALVTTFSIPFISSAASSPLNAVYVKEIPRAYDAQERFIASLRNAHAATVIINLPVSREGMPDTKALPNIVYLVHQAGMKLFVVLPARTYPAVLVRHPSWEDKHVAPGGSIESSGKLDLFIPEAAKFVVDLAGEIASYFPDGILLDQDFFLGPLDGMGGAARNAAERKIGMSIKPNKLYAAVEEGPEGPTARGFTDSFWKWTDLKRQVLLSLYDAVRTAARSPHDRLQIGLPIPLVYPVTSSSSVLAQYAMDVADFRQRDADCYWTEIDFRDIKERRNLTYSQIREIVSRLSKAAVTTVKDQERTLIILQSVAAGGQAVPISELDEMWSIVRRAGGQSIGLTAVPNSKIDPAFGAKIFH